MGPISGILITDQAFWDTVLPWLIGCITTIIGFVSKLLIDYFWLKSPRLIIKASLRPLRTNPPLNSYRKYEYQLQLEIENHSKNEAYGLEVKNISMPTDLIMNIHTLTEDFQHVVSDNITAKITAECYITLPVNDSNRSADAKQRMKDFKNSIDIKLGYKNQLGKRYSKTLTVVFQNKLSITHSLRVVNFTPTNEVKR